MYKVGPWQEIQVTHRTFQKDVVDFAAISRCILTRQRAVASLCAFGAL